MSRYADKPAVVIFGANGVPAEVSFGRTRLVVVGVMDAWREWYDVLDGGPERDIWILETENGVCEIHGLRVAVQLPGETERACDQWLLCRWED